MLNLIIVQFVSLSLTVPSLLLYLAECWFIFKGRNNKYAGSFYKIFLLSAVNNILINFVHSLFTFRAASFPPLFGILTLAPSWLARVVFAMYYYHLHVENVLTLLVLVHRLSAIVKSLTYEKAWKKLLPYLSALSFTLPLILVGHIFFIEVQWLRYTADDGTDNVALTYDHQIYSNAPSNSKITFIVSAIFLFLCLFVNCAIVVAYKRANAKNNGSSGEHNAQIEFRLMTYTLLIFLTQAFVCVYWIAIYVLQFSNASLFDQILGHYILLNDARAVLFPAWFLLWAASDVRKSILMFCCCCRRKMGTNHQNGHSNGIGDGAAGSAATSSMIANRLSVAAAQRRQQRQMPIKSVNVVLPSKNNQKYY